MPETAPVTHRLYAVVRTDLGMSAGKCCSQAGHGFLDSFLAASSDAARCAAYRAVRHGTKVALGVDSLDALLRVWRKAQRLNLPHALVIDEGCANFFGGRPIVTALGIGPLTRSEANKIVGGIPLLSLTQQPTEKANT